MAQKARRITALLLFLLLALSFTGCRSTVDWQGQRDRTAHYLNGQLTDGTLDIAEGEWALLGIQNSGITPDADQKEAYYTSVRAKVKTKKGLLSETRYTEYARVSMGVRAVGENPEDVEGYNLLAPLDRVESVRKQGLNAAIYALIAANYCGYTLSVEAEKGYLDDIRKAFEEEKNTEMGQALPDYAGMALQALAYYKDDPEACRTADRIYERIETYVKENIDMGTCEGNAQLILGLSAMGIDVTKEKRFMKDGQNLLDALMTYAKGDGFTHLAGGDTNIIASQQSLMALDALSLVKEGKMLLPPSADQA